MHETAEKDVEHGGLQNRTHFLWNQQRYLIENIKLSDSKAGFVMTFAAALLSAGLSPGGRVSLSLTKVAGVPHGYVAMSFALLGVCGLVASALFGAWSIKPRVRSDVAASPVSWVNVARYRSVGEFQQASRGLTNERADDYLAEQMFYMSKVCVTKHKLVSNAIVLAVFGGICLALSIALR